MGVRILQGDLEVHLQQPYTTYDVVIISRPYNYERFAPIVRELQPQAAVVYDAEALYFRRTERQALLSDDPSVNERLRVEARTMQRSEQRYFSDADQAVCISEVEASFARKVDGASPVHVIDARLHTPRWTPRPFDRRRDAVLVAGWLSGGNRRTAMDSFGSCARFCPCSGPGSHGSGYGSPVRTPRQSYSTTPARVCSSRAVSATWRSSTTKPGWRSCRFDLAPASS